MNFKDFNFKSPLLYGITRAGFKEPSPIQAAAIPPILEGRDLVGQAHTGTGKTAAFALPLLEKSFGDKGVEIVVLVPTRELATQVADEFYRFSRNLEMKTATVYGGTSYGKQLFHIGKSHIIVATPGRFLDLLTKGKVQINPRFVVIDEADEMLNMGFLEDVRRIFDFFGEREQTLMFSATMPEEIKDLAETLMKKPEFIRVEKEVSVTKNSIKQFYHVVEEHERDRALLRILENQKIHKAIVFCRTKRETTRIADLLTEQGYSAKALHGDIEQDERQRVMKGFKRNEFPLLVATDVASRGIDVKNLSHVINFHIPLEPELYVHRIGRTGRADKTGTACMLVTPHELRELKRIQTQVGSELTLEPLPSKKLSFDEKLGILHTSIESELPEKETERIVSSLLEKFKENDLLYRLVSLTHKSLVHQENIGKETREVEQLLSEIGLDFESENTRSGERFKSIQEKKSTSRTRKEKKEDDAIYKPDIERMGSARIIPRKIF